MREHAVKGLLVIVGLILFAPLIGVLGAERFVSMYGVGPLDHNLEILMRHRAVLFGIIGGFVIYAAFRTHLRLVAIAGAAISLVSFLAIAFAIGGYNDEINSVVNIDIFAIACLAVAAILIFQSS